MHPGALKILTFCGGGPPLPPGGEGTPPPTWHGTWHYNVEESEIFVTLRSCVMLW